MAVTLYAAVLISSLLVAVRGSTNLAYMKSTHQSTTAHSGVSGRAVDGNLNTVYSHHSCTHTLMQDSPYWSVDLDRTFYIHEVRITNRGDCCGNRLRNVDISVGDGGVYRPVGHVASVPQGGTISVKTGCNKPAGRHLEIRLRNRGILTLCEVQVFGSEYISRNLALHSPTSQSSTAHGGVPWRAVDGMPYACYSQLSCTHTHRQHQPHWKVDLGRHYYIHTVAIINRGDCCAHRLRNFDIKLASHSNIYHVIGRVFAVSPGGRKTSIRVCSNISGRYLMIQLRGTEYLTLCEVDVFGSALV